MVTTLDQPMTTDRLDGIDGVDSLSHSVFRSFEELAELEERWNEFVEQSGGDLYSSYEWCRTWWKYYGNGRELEIHLFQRENRIVALFPTFREILRLGPLSIRLIRLVGCDHSTTTCGVVIAPGEIETVIAAYAKWLSRSQAWDMVHWAPLAGYFPHRQVITQEFRKNGFWTVYSSGDGGPHIVWDLPATFDAFLAGLSKKERSNIKIARKKNADETSQIDSVTTPHEVERWLPTFFEQHQTQWHAEGKLGHFADWPMAQGFHQELACRLSARGCLQLLRLDVPGHSIGFQYNYVFNRRVHWLLGSRDIDTKWDPFSSGRVLHVETIQQAIARGDHSIDGLRGLYDYKIRLGGKVTQLQSIVLIRRAMVSRVKAHLARYVARLLDLFYYRLWFSRIAPRLPFQRRGLWTLWIRSRI